MTTSQQTKGKKGTSGALQLVISGSITEIVLFDMKQANYKLTTSEMYDLQLIALHGNAIAVTDCAAEILFLLSIGRVEKLFQILKFAIDLFYEKFQ